MRKTIIVIAALLTCVFGAEAQRVIDTREAHSGKDLTMEEAIYRGVGYSRSGASWESADEFVIATAPGKVLKGGVSTSELTDYTPSRRQRSEWDEGPAGNAVKLQGSSFIGRKADGTEVTIGRSDTDAVVFGGTAMRNEFGFEQGYLWSPSGRKVAFYRKDQSKVTLFPLLDIGTRTGSLESIRYPMNGMASERLAVGIYDFDGGYTTWLCVDDFGDDRYITNLAWSPSEEFIFAQVVDRAQHNMHLNKYSVASGKFVRTLLTESNDAWIEPLDPVWFLREDVLLYRTDNRDGYRNLYLLDTLGTVRRMTAVKADIAYLGNDGRNVFYTSAEVSPVENHLFKMEVKLPRKDFVKKARLGKPVQLTRGRGWHTVQLSSDFRWFLDRYSNVSTPSVLSVASTDGKAYRQLFAGSDPLEGYASCKVEMGTFPSADGAFDNYYRLIYPKDFDASKQYPLVVYVYGGPHSQMVQDSWLGEIRMWEMLMAQKGYFVYVQDNRGTQNRGAAFEKAINRRCGVAEMEDQMVGVQRLLEKPYIDATRVGVHGWSYGGFMTISLMTHYPSVFKVGVAGGPVIDWKWYEIMYGERYMDNPSTNPDGFAETSLLNWAPKLSGKLLICQGAMDDTVVWEHSLSFIQECIDREIPVDYFPYPTAKHNVFGRNRIHLMDKVTAYFEDYL